MRKREDLMKYVVEYEIRTAGLTYARTSPTRMRS